MAVIVTHPTTLNRMACRLQYHWSRNYRAIHSAPALEFGKAIHYALERYYCTEHEDPIQAFERYMDENGGPTINGYKSTDRDLGIAMLRNYLKEYAHEQFTVFYTEKEVARRVPVPEDDPNPPKRARNFYIAARIDAVVFDRVVGKLFVLEHKTFDTFYPGSLSLDHQFVVEKYVAEGICSGQVAGVIYNGLRKKSEPSKTTKLFERHTLFINDEQVKVMLHRAYWSLMAVTSKDYHIFPEPSTMKCNMCEFKQPCAEYQRGGDYQFYLENMFEKRSEDEETEEWQ